MTEDEHITMVEAGNRFWYEFSELCQQYIDAAPEHLKVEYEYYLGDKTSIFGRKTLK
jgi:hypothetical protein